jgi:signal peptidase I
LADPPTKSSPRGVAGSARPARSGPGAASGAEPGAGAEGSAAGLGDEGAQASPDARDEGRDPFLAPPGRDGRLLRVLFHLVWVGIVPLGLAVGAVWLLTPAAGDRTAGGLRLFVAEQQIPAGIVLFTLFAMGLWRFRHELPLAATIGVAGRRDLPASARGRFEEAAILLEESHRILRGRARSVERELTSGERDQIRQALAHLERVMTAERFDLAEFDAAHARADRLAGEHLSRWRKGEMREYAESIAIAVAVALVLRAFVVEAFKIPSGSMIPTLMIGDHIFVNKFTYGPLVPWTDSRLFSQLPPQRGDVIVFRFPEKKEQDFIKRAVAIPGDTLEAIDGRPVINGWLAPHCYAGPYQYDGKTAELYVEFLGDRSFLTLYDNKLDDVPCRTNADCEGGRACRGVCGRLEGPFKVQPNEVWVMGDNRNNSHDSRSWRGGLGGGVPFEYIKGRAMFVWMSFGSGGGIAQDRLLVNVMGRPKLPGGHEQALGPGVERCMANRPSLADSTPPQQR